jgi:hypothetical protein
VTDGVIDALRGLIILVSLPFDPAAVFDVFLLFMGELVINLKTEKQIGVNIPQSVVYRADKVIK